MLKISLNSYLLAFSLFILFPSLTLAQLPDFEELDKNRDGLIDEIEYKEFLNSQDENTNFIEKEQEEVQNKKTSLDLSKYISLGQSFIDTANIISPSCTTFSQCTGEPAIFSYTVTGDEDIFSINAAIALKFLSLDERLTDDGARRYTNLIAEPVIEANVSSADSTSNYVRAAIPFIFSFNDKRTLFPTDRKKSNISHDEPSFFQQHNLIIVPKYEADQEFDTQTIGLDLLYTPTIPDIGIGAAIRKSKFGFRWRPVVGFEFGNVIKNSENLSTLPADTFARATARLKAELGITDDSQLNADYVFYLDLTGDQDINDFVNISFQYFLDDQQNISVGLEYTNGGRAPTFEDADFLRTFLGLRF